MDKIEVMTIGVNLGDDSHMAYAATVAATAKEHKVTWFKVAALNSLAVVHLKAGTAGKFVAKLSKYIASET